MGSTIVADGGFSPGGEKSIELQDPIGPILAIKYDSVVFPNTSFFSCP